MKDKNKDKLEKFILENRDEFEMENPPNGLWNAIEKDLEREEGPKTVKLRPWKILRKIAAAVVLLLAAYGVYDIAGSFTGQNNQGKAETETINPEILELNEARAYYSMKVNNTMDELKSYCDRYPDLCNELLAEANDLENNMSSLRNDLEDGAHSMEILEAMVEGYRMKLKILENILENVERVEKMENSIRIEN